ncbi:glycine--tRNA ligase subunit beta [Sphingomonas sp. TF3]|uniref:glycine--tRNA ligase subunit beta n=1 Tax=Sphingomonas sp. TF3 TaxID=2495580 RepID=UPI000F85E42D|nr:glycine--tRNA ligase subunit beta [Sphingomonas sp. TF3]RUN76871.1 glycine--tRNA ligase subunit beta [Sphingomonas sp. TF3]
MTDFLLELRSEEIPARMQDRAREDLAKLFTAEIAKSGLTASEIVTYATPRRLTLIARGLPLETAAVSEETKGPKASAPPQALEGFLRKTGLTREQLVERDGVLFAIVDKPGRATSAVLAEAIPAIIRAFPWPKAMRWGASSTTMESLRWVRPLQGIVALFGEDVVPVEIAGVQAGAATVGHRFHHPGVITIGSADDYVEKLRACHVIVDQAERRQIIALGATMAARKAGLELVQDEGLLTENAGLTEWPVPLLGRFEESFLAVPPEVIQLTARVNQKYFVCRDASGALANAFVCTANIDAADGGAKIVEGNRKVLAARLSDAKFFWEEDQFVFADSERKVVERRKKLDELLPKLEQIVFHEKLGTVADKVKRVVKLALWLVDADVVKPIEDSPQAKVELYNLVQIAATFAKADLVTGMVGEFPELQGLMGGYYAAAQGEDPRVAAAIRDHYKPVGQGDDVPTDPVTVAVSLADKLDTIAQFFSIDAGPTGSRDPFALRRAALGIIAIVKLNGLRLSLFFAIFEVLAKSDIGIAALVKQQEKRADLLTTIFDQFGIDAAVAAIKALLSSLEHNGFEKQISQAVRIDIERAMPVAATVRDFMIDRLEVAERDVGVRADIIRAARIIDGTGAKEDDLVRLLARVHALQAFIGTEDGVNLLAGYKRAANILKKEGVSPSPLRGEGRGEGDAATGGSLGNLAQPLSPALSPEGEREKVALSYTPEPAEAALALALDSAEPAAAAAVAREDFEAAMAALATLRAPIDAFFEGVIVNDSDPEKRAARLALLDRVRAAVHNVADFSKIEG